MQTRLFSSVLRGAFLGFAVLTFVSPARAASNLNSSKSNTYRQIANQADRSACTEAGGRVVIKNGAELCEIATGANPDPQEGITITGCTPSASGDPLKGLNVSKGGASSGGQLCP
jgi:hypothetical protein